MLAECSEYSFEWQWNYPFDADFDELPVFAQGHVLTLDCGYNNSMSNPLLAGALQRAGKKRNPSCDLGDETLDEMCLTVMTLVFERDTERGRALVFHAFELDVPIGNGRNMAVAIGSRKHTRRLGSSLLI